ncbi:MAG: hypothetical protein AAF740_14615 [Bacteroidota bacterium]
MKSYKTTLYYLTSSGERYNGTFKITPDEVIFEAQMHLASSGIQDVEGEIRIAREDITELKPFRNNLIFNRLRIKEKSGTVHVFDRGISSFRSILKRLRA